MTQDEMKRAVIDAACAVFVNCIKISAKDKLQHVITNQEAWRRFEKAVDTYLDSQNRS